MSSSERQEDMNPDHLIMAALFALLLIYGPNKLPQLGNALGKTVKNVRDGMDGVGDDEAAIVRDSTTDADRQ
jgi:sec-independent protein translocase protein TatA